MYLEILVREFCDYSKYIKGYSNLTVRRYRKVIHYYSKEAGVERIDQVTEDNIRALFYHGRSERKWSSATYISYYFTLSVFFSWCIGQKLIQFNPVKNLEIPKLEKRIPANLNEQEALKLLEVTYNYPYPYEFLRYRNHAIFSMFIFSGLRRSELLKLKFADVDIDNLSIHVIQGKGNKDRYVPMSTKLAQILKRYIPERKKLNKTCPEFFVSFNRNQGYTENGIKRLVVQMRKASSIYFSIHKLRHTFATLMLEGGCDIFSLSKMMGHSDIKTTTIYLAASKEHLRSQMTKHPLND